MREKWLEPVKITMPISGQIHIEGPSEALVILSDKWPDLRGPRYVSARSFCRAAIAGRKPHEEARACFVEAAKEANMMH